MRLVRYIYPTFRNSEPAFAAFRRSPWSGLENEIDRLFTTVLTDGVSAGVRFPIDLYRDANHVYVRAELPGVNRDDIHVELTNGQLTLAAVRKTTTGDTGAEQSVSFSREINVGDEVAADQVAAAFENGVLTVTLPKREETKPKKISVTVK